MQLTIVSLQVGLPQTRGNVGSANPMDRPWTSGFIKEPVTTPLWAGTTGLAGDGQADLVNHGGPDKAINTYPLEHYEYWLSDLGFAELPPGAFGENFTLTGATEEQVCIGDVFESGTGAVFQISQPRQPCWKLARRWRVKDLAVRVDRNGKTGWYLRVLREGEVAPGTTLTLTDRPYPEWTIAAANQVMHRWREDPASATRLASCEALSASWRGALGGSAT